MRPGFGMRRRGSISVVLALAIAACTGNDGPPASTKPPPCVDRHGNGWLACAALQQHTSCCGANDPYCTEKDVAHGCSTGSWLGASLVCDCGWSDCDDDLANGCETDLTSNASCGACGVHAASCSIGAPGPAQAEVLFASGYQPQGLVVDDQNVYWMSDGVLTSAPKAGGPATVLAEGESSWNATMAISNGRLYWPWLTGAIHRIAVSGGPVEVLASGIGPIESNIVAFGDTAFVIVARGSGGELVDTLGHDLLPTAGAGSLAVGNDVLYVADSRALRSVHVDGTQVTKIASGPGLLATNASSLFMVSDSAVYTYADGGAQPTVAGRAPVRVLQAVATDTLLYVAADAYVPANESGWFDSPSVRFLGTLDPKTGVTTALVSRPPPGGIYGGFLAPAEGDSQLAVDTAYVYFATFGSDCAPGNVYRLAR